MTIKNRIKKNPYLFFAFNLLYLLLIVFLLDFSIGNFLRHFYFKQESGKQYETTYTIETTKADILIFGSSRAEENYVPDVFENRLKHSCYNNGCGGQYILFDYGLLKAVFKRHTPKLIILDLTPEELMAQRGSPTRDRLSQLLPYYKSHPEIRPIVDLKGPFEKFKLFSSIYPYNSSAIYIAASRLEAFKKRNIRFKGYKPSSAVWNKPRKIITPEPNPIDSVKLNIYKNFINECRQAGVELYIVCTPVYDIFKEKPHSLSVAKKVAEEQGIRFIDFTNDPFFTRHPELFSFDARHCNDKGAHIFSNKLIDLIEDSLQD